jgi:ABC-2 type transport system permease protein
VWFRSIFLKTLRDYRVAILSWGLGIGVLAPIVFASISGLLADSPDVRAELLALVQNPAFRLFGEPVDVLHAGGYATWRLSLVFPLVGVWALLAASRTLRGEEERRSLDALLSVPRSRLRVATEKLAAIGTALLLIGMLIGLLAFAGGKGTGVELSMNEALLFGLNIALLAFLFGTLALLLSQFTRERRPAAGMTGALLGLSFVLTSAGRTVPNGEWIGRLSPLYYFELSKPLIPGYGANGGAMLVLAALSAGLGALGVALFVRRDIGAPVALPFGLQFPERPPRSARALPMDAWWLRSVFAHSLRSLAAATLWWGLVIAAYAALITAILRQAEQNLADLLKGLSDGNPMYADLIVKFTGGGDVATNVSFLNLIFTLLAVVVAAFALTLANRWAADEEEGRLELLLGTPRPRPLVILVRFGSVTLALLVVAGLILTSVGFTAAAVGMKLDTSRLAQAAFGIVPVGLVVAAVGYLLSGWLRTPAVTGILIALLLSSLTLTLLGTLFSWPKILLQLSIFDQYGAPLVDGLRVSNTLALLAVAAAALAIATLRFARKDIAR